MESAEAVEEVEEEEAVARCDQHGLKREGPAGEAQAQAMVQQGTSGGG